MAPTRPSAKGKRGRASRSSVKSSSKTKNQEPKQGSSKQKTSRKRSSQPQDEPVSSRKSATRVEPVRTRKRRTRDAGLDEPDEIAAETTTARKYVHLAPKTKRIPQQVIETWPKISTPVLEQISLMLKRAKDGIALSRRDPRRREEADEVLNTVIRQLERHFAATKIPPQAKALHFDLDRLTDRNEQIYREVTTARHRKQLLEEQIETATARLTGEEKLARELKENAQQWRRRWKSQEKKQLHPLLQQPDDVEMVDDRPDDIGLRKSTPIDTSMFDVPDPDLATLLDQLRRNLETMQGNHAQVEGIDEAVLDARIALDDVLFKHTRAQQYDAL